VADADATDAEDAPRCAYSDPDWSELKQFMAAFANGVVGLTDEGRRVWLTEDNDFISDPSPVP
jgi:hypothetical protein